MADRIRRYLASRVLAGLAVAFSWFYTQWTHEAGHVIGALVSGGGVERVILDPLTISRTDVHPNPAPLFVAWSGPVGGALIGSAIALGLVPLTGWWIWRLIAAFVFLANGVYIGAGVVYPVGDARDLIDLGAPVWLLGAFGSASVGIGVGIAATGARMDDKQHDVPHDAKPRVRAGASLVGLIILLGVVGAVCFPG
jgi:hypothetical protein